MPHVQDMSLEELEECRAEILANLGTSYEEHPPPAGLRYSSRRYWSFCRSCLRRTKASLGAVRTPAMAPKTVPAVIGRPSTSSAGPSALRLLLSQMTQSANAPILAPTPADAAAISKVFLETFHSRITSMSIHNRFEASAAPRSRLPTIK